MSRARTECRGASRWAQGLAGACVLLGVTGCADQVLGAVTRAQDRQCSQLVVPEQREACLRDVNGQRPATVPRDLERPRPAPSDPAAVRKDDAAARAARRGAADAPAAAASAP
jgi:hypothetical protein